jgi:Zn-dependent peptidase ImmA (M78 family)/DNA-binding XRE family transcriptional regulator
MIAMRIRQARLAAGWSQDQLSERMTRSGRPVTKAAISKYETGKSIPSASVLLTLAQVLGMSVEMLQSSPSLEITWLAFRRRSSLSAVAQERIQQAAALIAEHQFNLESMLHPNEQPRFPDVRRVTTPDEAEAAAQAVRQHWGLGDQPVHSVVGRIEDAGGVVIPWEGEEEGFDGLAGWVNDARPLMVLSMRSQADRLRFSAAHELGHLLMDTSGLPDKDQEKLAHRFAAALLVPASAARRELGERRRRLEWAEVGLLKQKYGMSMSAWVFRAKDLGIISEGYSREMWQQMSERDWRRHEPTVYDFTGQEQPYRLRQMVLRAVTERLITPEQGRRICRDCFTETAAPPDAAPDHYSAHDLLRLPPEERSSILARMFSEAANEDFEIFNAEGEGDFDDDDEEVDFAG